MEFNVKYDVDQVRLALKKAHNDVVDKAAVASLNRVGSQVRTEAARQVGKQRNLKAGYIKEHIKQMKAHSHLLMTKIRATGRPISLRQYGAHNTRAGVSVKISRDGARKIVHKYGNKAFAFSRGTRPPRGNVQHAVMVRKGSKRTPIEKLYGPSIPTAFVKHAAMQIFRVLAESKWPARFEHELRYRLEKLGFTVK